SRRSFRPRIVACAWPENGVSAANAMSTVSCREPPRAHPIQFSSVRLPSLRAPELRSYGFADTMYRARARVTSAASSADCDVNLEDDSWPAAADRPTPPTPRRNPRRWIVLIDLFRFNGMQSSLFGLLRP